MRTNRIIEQHDIFSMLAQVAKNFESELKLADQPKVTQQPEDEGNKTKKKEMHKQSNKLFDVQEAKSVLWNDLASWQGVLENFCSTDVWLKFMNIA